MSSSYSWLFVNSFEPETRQASIDVFYDIPAKLNSTVFGGGLGIFEIQTNSSKGVNLLAVPQCCKGKKRFLLKLIVSVWGPSSSMTWKSAWLPKVKPKPTRESVPENCIQKTDLETLTWKYS